MNILFGIVIAAFSVVFIYFACKLLIPSEWWDRIPEQYREPAKKAFSLSFGIALAIVVLTNFKTYGPRNELRPTAMPTAPEIQPIVESKPIFGTEESRMGQFKKIIEEKKKAQEH